MSNIYGIWYAAQIGEGETMQDGLLRVANLLPDDAPVVREPLSHKHLLELYAPLAVSLPSGWEWWARVIERAHGITGDRNG